MSGSDERTTTYARARLRVGIGAVGSLVVLASASLLLDLPARWLSGLGGTPPADAGALLAVLLAFAVAALPFDVLGGLVLPRRFGRPHPRPPAFALGWLRGVLVLASLSAVAGALLLAAGRAGGRPAALAVLSAISYGLLSLQEPLARWVGGLRRLDARPPGLPDDVVLLDGADPGFTGGFEGAGGGIVLPARWLQALEPAVLELLVERRRRIRRSGALRRTRLLAVGWNVLGFGVATLVPGAGVTTVAELVGTALAFTLWTFVGLLLLPTPSRRGTARADALVTADPAAEARLAEAVAALDRLQDDEPRRAAGVERVFHPVPSVERRLAALRAGERPAGGAWHLARTALYLSHAGLSLLPRAVHCNAGRPELWVYLPADG